MKRVAFLDRDGTINREVDYLRCVDQLELLPGAADAVQRLDAAGFTVVVLTNQSGIARGLLRERDLAHIHAELHRRLHKIPRAYLHCPHLPPDDRASTGGPHAPVSSYVRHCTCRKPAPGMLHAARELLGVPFAGGALIGDSARDLLLGAGLPLTTIHVHSGKPVAEQERRLDAGGCRPDHSAADLAAAVDWLLRR